MVPDNWNFNGSNPCLYHGGNYNQIQNHGPFYVYYFSASYSNVDIGCRLLAKPQANPPFGSRGSSPFLYRTVDRLPLSDGAGTATRTAAKENGETSTSRFCGRTNMFTTLLCSR